MTEETIARLYEHLAWADARVLDVMNRSAEARGGPAARLFSHLLAAERVWLLRLRGQESGHQAIWPELAPVEMNAMAAANRFGYARLLAELGPEGLGRVVAYTNQQGHAYRTAVGDVLLHVALHGAHHRGQVARALREAGVEPVNTDYITWVRELPEPASLPAAEAAWAG